MISDVLTSDDRFWLGELAQQRGRSVARSRERRLRAMGLLERGRDPWRLTDRGREVLFSEGASCKK